MTPEQIMEGSAALLNDQARATYTNAVQLAYFNTALRELQEIFEENNIPVTNETSSVITVPAATTVIGFSTTPALPSNLVDIQRVWESDSGVDSFIPMTRREFLSPPGALVGKRLVWAWMNQELRLYAGLSITDIKLDYIKSLFTPFTLATIDQDLGIINVDTFLQYRTASLCAMFIEENLERAGIMDQGAYAGLNRSLGISVKGKQSIQVRRRPFRAAFKSRYRMG